ncbi:hypothetical protein [uncultured Varibaculum sp.]|uniref:hypothetical protein n=1 Tax=uncultured Varibaculum sp. TaxID=413896 RepID=UPI002805DE0E|nr:hypothetical protein [uncultured Varibaculum sp.]
MKKEAELAAPALILGIVVTLALSALIFMSNFYMDRQKEIEVSNNPAIVAAWDTGKGYTCLTKDTLEFRKCEKKGEKIVLGKKTDCPNENAAFTKAGMGKYLIAVTTKSEDFNFFATAKAPPKNKVLTCYGHETKADCTWDGTEFHFSGAEPK